MALASPAYVTQLHSLPGSLMMHQAEPANMLDTGLPDSVAVTTAPLAAEGEIHEKPKPTTARRHARRLTLEDAINRALKANRGLVEAMDHVEGTRLSIVPAEAEFELKLLPGAQMGLTGTSDEGSEDSFGTGITLQKRFAPGTEASIEPNIQKTGDTYRTGVDTKLTQPLLRGLNREFNLSGIRGAEFAARSARRAFYLTQVNTVLTTIGVVYDVIRQRELVRLNEDSAARLRGHAEAAKVKEKIGLATQIDIYRAGIQQKQAEDNLTTAREAYRDALDNLKVLLALPLEEEIEVEAPLKYTLERLAEEEAVRMALENRVELDQAADTIREARRQSRNAKHNTWPDLNVVMNYSRFGSADTFGNSRAFDQDSWGVSLVTSTDLARTVENIAYDQSLLTVRAARRSASLQHDEVAMEVKRDLRNLHRSEQRIAIQEQQIRQAKGQLELAQVKFRWGLANNFDLIQAEMELRRAQTNLLSAVLDYIVGSHRLRAAMGTLLERPERF